MRRGSSDFGVLDVGFGGLTLTGVLAAELAAGREVDLRGARFPAAALAAVLVAPGSGRLRLRRAVVTGELQLVGVELLRATAKLPTLQLPDQEPQLLYLGLSRVLMMGSDVLGAYLLSGMWLALSLALSRRWKRRATFHPEEAEEVASRQ